MTGHSDPNVIPRIEGRPDEKLLRRKVNAGFAGALLLTVLLSLLSWRSSQRAAEDADWVAHTQEVSLTLERTLRYLVDVETGARGFALTGQKLFLEPYEAGKYAASQDFASLGVLMVDRDQTLRLATLVEQANARIAAADDLVTSRQSSGRAPDVAQLEHGKELMDSVRVTVKSMEEAEKQLLEERTNRARAARRLTTFVIWMGSILGMLFLFIAGITVSREIDVSAQARAQVNALNSELERRVEQRTTELQSEIAARMGTEAKLRASEGRLAGIIASAMDAIITVDSRQRILLFNAAAAKAFRCSEADALGQPIDRFIPQRIRSAHTVHMRQFGKSGITSRAVHRLGALWAVRADGEEFQIEASISQIEIAGEKMLTVILRDVTERRQADEIRERLAAVVDSSDDAIISKDLEGNINAWNRGAEKIFGYSASEVLCKPVLMLIPPERIEEESEILSRIRKGESVEHFETVRVRKDGTRIDVSVTISPIRDGSGAIVGASKIGRDITERKRAEQALSESHARLKKVLEVETVGVLFWNLTTGALKDANNTFLNLMGYSRRDMEAGELTWQKLTPPEYLEVSRAELRKYAVTGRVGPYEKEYFHKDGTRQWFVFAGSSIGGDSCVEFCVDISDRKKAEAALHESENRFRTLIEQASDAFFLHDSDGRFLEVNRQACESLGYTMEELLRMCVFDVEQGIDKGEAQHAWKRAEPGKPYTLQGHQRRKDGTVFPVEARLSAYYIDGQKLHLGLVRDTTERRRAEEALRQKEYLLSESQRIAHIGSWVYDPGDPTGTIKWSDELYRIHGVSPETFTPTVESFLSLVAPEDRPAMQKWIAACAAGENAGDLEFRVRLPDGSTRVLMGRGELQRNSENNLTLMTGTSQDITDRKRAEDALRESEEQFQAMANGIPQLASMSNADGSVIWYNRRWYEYTGTTPEQMHGCGWQTVHDPETVPSVLERWQASIASGEPFDMEFPLRGADGIFRMFLTRVMPLKNAEGRVVRWFGTNTDISELKEVEKRLATQAEQLARSGQALEAQTAMLNLVLDSMGEGLVAANREGRFLLWNSSASKLLSRGSTTLPPEQWSSYYACYQPDGITPCPMDQLPLVRATQGESLQKELIIRHAGSEDSAILEFSGRPMKDAQGNLCGGVVAFRDITQRKKDEWEIRKLNEELEMKVQQRTAQLEAANHELEAFTYSVSHDLRAPLRHISSFSSILREDFGTAMDAEARRLLERIENGARRMTQLVDGLLSLARFGRQALNISLTELNAIVDRVVSVLQTECSGRDVEWRIAPLPALECDPILMQQVFQNLLANALKYSSRRDKAVIEIDSIQQTGKPPVIFVRDNGAGFSMQHAEKLFGVFQRMHSDAEFEGTGVGLATVNRIIQRHGGRIWAEAEVDRGATFYFAVTERDPAGSTPRATSGALEHEHEHRG